MRIGIRTAPSDPDTFEVVGVVGDVRSFGQWGPVPPRIYVPHAQSWPSLSLVVRTSGEPALLVGPLRREVAALNPGGPPPDVRLLSALASDSLAPNRFVLGLLGTFAGMAALLTLATLLAGYLPARRASRVDPASCGRSETAPPSGCGIAVSFALVGRRLHRKEARCVVRSTKIGGRLAGDLVLVRRSVALAATLLALAGHASAQSLSAAPAPPQAPSVSSKVWVGRYAEFEEYLRTAPIERLTDVPVGVTHPRRAYFAPGGLARSAAVKSLPPGVRGGFWDSYKSEIAAYELDRLLDLDMVPPTVERRVGHELASVQLWVDGCRVIKDVDQNAPHDPVPWNRENYRQRVFDNLIANIDDNAGNILVDPPWNMILIDHSRCFFSDSMPFEKEMTHIDRPLFEKLKALDEGSLMARLRPWVLSGSTVRQVLKRRDKIVARFEARVRELGEDKVFIP